MFHWKLMIAMFVLILFIIINKREPFDDISRNILIDKELTNVHGKTLIDLDNDKLIASNLGYISQINTENTNYPLQGPILANKTIQKDAWVAMYDGPLNDEYNTVQETLKNASTAIGECLTKYYSFGYDSSKFTLFSQNAYRIKPESAFVEILNRLKASFVRTMCAINMHNHNIQFSYNQAGFVYMANSFVSPSNPSPSNSTIAFIRYISGYLNILTGSTYTTLSTKQIVINTTNKDTSDYKGFISIDTKTFDDLIIAYDTVINNNTLSVNTTKYSDATINTNRLNFILANVGGWDIYAMLETTPNLNRLNYINDSINTDIRAFPRGVLFGEGWYSIKCRYHDYWSDSRNGFAERGGDDKLIKGDLVGLGATVRAGWEAFYLKSTGSPSYFKIMGNNTNNKFDHWCRDSSDIDAGMKCAFGYDYADAFYIQEIENGIYSIRGGRNNNFLRYDNVIRSDRGDTSSTETHFIINPIVGPI